MRNSPIALVIFDCDGVLIDSEPIASRTLALALRGAGVSITAEDALRAFTGNSETTIRQMCVDSYGVSDIDGMFARWHEMLRLAFASELTAMAGMVQLVAGLTLPKCVASNSRIARLAQSLGNTPLWSMFAPHIYSAEHVARPKPAPDLLLHCAKQFDVAASRCVMIDDSAHGISAAKAADMLAIGFVDPNDPRPGRTAILESAGADHVATGAGELALLMHGLAEGGMPARPAPVI